MALSGAGLVVALIFGVILLIQAFKVHVLWGLAYLFVPFAALVYVVKYWEDARKPFLYSLLSLPLLIGGSVLAGLGS
ncbi:MAG: hypothetical protein CVV27_12795 [Candidatus Melainabacteria bacterium HGW-Melainabacteria-1]|nr:MAG: hypothetical protein CVV27_12795 [Candidatus Melainabacteria bacterium HGW-Melainabacteria-1]